VVNHIFGLDEVLPFLTGKTIRLWNVCTGQTKYALDLLKIFRMMNCKEAPTLLATRTKLNKEDKGSNVDPNLFKRQPCVPHYH
jgi:hypothetical protein